MPLQREAGTAAEMAGETGVGQPLLKGKHFSQPIVTSAITHGLALVGDLFVDEGDVIVLPDKLWGNYRLIFAPVWEHT